MTTAVHTVLAFSGAAVVLFIALIVHKATKGK